MPIQPGSKCVYAYLGHTLVDAPAGHPRRKCYADTTNGLTQRVPRYREITPRLLEHPPFFNWGNQDSGSAQLALSLLADFTGNEGYALTHYQDFTLDIISRLTKNYWILPDWIMREWMKEPRPILKNQHRLQHGWFEDHPAFVESASKAD